MDEFVVFAQSGNDRVVRSEGDGRWYVQLGEGRPWRKIRARAAVSYALTFEAEGGQVFYGRPGGARFEQRLAQLRPLYGSGVPA